MGIFGQIHPIILHPFIHSLIHSFSCYGDFWWRFSMGIQFLWKVRKRQRWDEGLNKQIKTIQNLKKRHYKYVSFTWFYFLSFKFYMCFLFYLYIFFDLQLFQFKKEKKMQLFLQWYDVNLYNILLKQLLSTGKVLIPKFIHASSNKWVYTPRRHRLFFLKLWGEIFIIIIYNVNV